MTDLITQANRVDLAENGFKRTCPEKNKAKTVYKFGKNISADIEHGNQMLETVIAKIQKLNLPSTVNAVSINQEINKELYTAKKFIEKISKTHSKKAVAQHQTGLHHLTCKIVSIKLGGQISPEMLENNNDYFKFIYAKKWHNIAVAYNQVLPVVNGEPGVLFEGEGISYSQLKNLPWLKDGVHPTSWGYWIVKKGLVNHWGHNFKKMVPNDHDDPAKWGNQYAVEIMTTLKDSHEYKPDGGHGWLRLKTPTGDIYSFGVYGPINTVGYLKNGFKVSQEGCCVDSPERCETLDKNENHFKGTTVKITEDDFKLLQEEMLKLSEKGVPFGFIKTNCTGHMKRLLKKVGIEIESSMTVFDYISRTFIPKKVRHFYDKTIPGFIKAIFKFIGNILQAPLLLIGRAGTIDKKVKDNWGNEFQADIPNFFDKFKTVRLEHPLALRKWQRKVDDWREKKISKYAQKKIKLANQKKEIETNNPQDTQLQEKVVKVEKQLNEIDAKIQAIPFSLPKKSLEHRKAKRKTKLEKLT